MWFPYVITYGPYVIIELNHMWTSHTGNHIPTSLKSHVNITCEHHIPTHLEITYGKSHVNIFEITCEHHILLVCGVHMWCSHVTFTYTNAMLVCDVHMCIPYVILTYQHPVAVCDVHMWFDVHYENTCEHHMWFDVQYENTCEHHMWTNMKTHVEITCELTMKTHVNITCEYNYTCTYCMVNIFLWLCLQVSQNRLSTIYSIS